MLKQLCTFSANPTPNATITFDDQKLRNQRLKIWTIAQKWITMNENVKKEEKKNEKYERKMKKRKRRKRKN